VAGITTNACERNCLLDKGTNMQKPCSDRPARELEDNTSKYAAMRSADVGGPLDFSL
jgi:hypothetical protein